MGDPDYTAVSGGGCNSLSIKLLERVTMTSWPGGPGEGIKQVFEFKVSKTAIDTKFYAAMLLSFSAEIDKTANEILPQMLVSMSIFCFVSPPLL